MRHSPSMNPGAVIAACTVKKWCTHKYLLGLNIFNWSSPGPNVRHFADDILICIFVNEKFCILIKISLKLVHSITPRWVNTEATHKWTHHTMRNKKHDISSPNYIYSLHLKWFPVKWWPVDSHHKAPIAKNLDVSVDVGLKKLLNKCPFASDLKHLNARVSVIAHLFLAFSQTCWSLLLIVHPSKVA